MKQIIEARTLPDGTVEPSHEIEVVCASCKDPVSEAEALTNICTNCGQPWQMQQNVSVTVTSLPSVQAMTITIG